MQQNAFSMAPQRSADFKFWKAKGWLEKKEDYYYKVQAGNVKKLLKKPGFHAFPMRDLSSVQILSVHKPAAISAEVMASFRSPIRFMTENWAAVSPYDCSALSRW